MKSSYKAIAAFGLAATVLAPASAMAWSKSYLVTWFEPAFYFGGPESGSPTAEGTDCPKGVNAMDWDKELITAYRPASRVAELRSPEYSRPIFLTHLGFRGPNKENVYENPTSIADPGLLLVEGKIAEGFNLDNNPNTGFTGVNGEKGVDNIFYKLAGCTDWYRGKPQEANTNLRSNREMQPFMTLVVVMSGEKDPMNDDNAQIGIYTSRDLAAKDPTGEFAADYSFRIDPNDQSIFKAKITNGVVEAVDRPKIRVRYSTRRNPSRTMTEFYQSKIRWEIRPDGSVSGLIGGYRDWRQLYLEMNVSSNIVPAAQTENLGHFSLPGMFYAMRREADGLPDPVTGKNRGISSVYRVNMIPAFVIAPEGDRPAQAAQVFVAK